MKPKTLIVMKMKTYKIVKTLGMIISTVATISILFSGCTDSFTEYNKDVTGLYKNDLKIDFKLVGEPIKQMQLNIYAYQPAWLTQLQQNLIADVYSGYMMPPTPFRNNSNNMNYDLVDGWNGFPWSTAYGSVMAPGQSALKLAKSIGSTDYYSWAKILRVEAMHRVSDIYGPIIYSKYGSVNADGSVDYDSQKDAYAYFFADLDSAITVLTPLAQNANAPKTFTNFDLVYGGDFVKWVKFANTLRLRLAIRISKVDPAMAKTQGEKALANPIGLLQSPGDNFVVNIDPTPHPLNIMNNSWGDIRMGAPMESIMTGYNDGRLPKYFVKSTDYPTQYKGIRNGIAISDKGTYVNFSQLITFPNSILLMTSAEAWFLKAEASIRGWAGVTGTAQSNYENGIKDSHAQYGLDATTYVADNVSKPIPYVDPKSATNNVALGDSHLSTITIKWDDAAAFETKLERIITQKWIAMYPDGQEAWSEFRRTTYPKLFPVIINNSNGKINTQKFIRRINFASSEYSTNAAGVAKAATLLGGPDTGGTPLWWDIN